MTPALTQISMMSWTRLRPPGVTVFDARDLTDQIPEPILCPWCRCEFPIAHLRLHLAEVPFRNLLEGSRQTPGDSDLDVVSGDAERAVAEVDALEPPPWRELGRRRHVLFAVVDPEEPAALERIDSGPLGLLGSWG